MSATKKKAVSSTTTEQFEDFAEQATISMKGGFEKLSKGFAEVGEFNKDNFDAIVESASTYAKGVEGIATEQASFTKEAVEKTVEQIKTVTAVKTPQEFFQLQTEFVRGAFEANLAQLNKVADLWTTTTKEAVEPLSKRYAAAVEKAQSFRA